MKPGRATRSIRTRITLWHLGVLVLILVLYMLLSQMFLWKQLTIELKASLQDDAEIAENFLKRNQDGRIVWGGHLDEHQDRERLFEIRDRQGDLLYRNFPENIFTPPRTVLTALHQKTFHTINQAKGRPLLLVREIHQVEGELVEILAARSTDRIFEEMGHLFLTQVLLFPLAVLLAWLGGYLIAGRVLAPLQQMIARMRIISADRLRERLPVENPGDEFGRLSLAFNDLLAKLDRSFEQMKLFTADASHELRTPLAVIRSVGEMALRSPKDAADCRETIASMLEEAEKMGRLVNDLLALARSESGIVQPVLESCTLGEVVGDEVALLKVLAEEKEQRLMLAVDESCPMRLDRAIFRQAFGNILYNAIKYTPVGGEIRVLVGREGEQCLVEVADSGPGIAPEHQSRVFNRFYRVDKVRSRSTGGAGLGLAIAKWAVEIHGGRIELESGLESEPGSGPGSGSLFRIRLPTAPPHPGESGEQRS